MIQSPCINICKLNSSNFCVGCNRTLEEIKKWTSLSDEQKLDILERVAFTEP